MMQCFSCSEDMQSVEYPESLIDGADYTWCSYSADRGALWCRSLMIMVCKVFAVSQSFCKTKSWTPDAWCPLDSDLRNPVAVHHYAAGVAPSCSGDGWSGRSLRVQSPDSEFIVMVPAEKRGLVPDLMLLTAEGHFLCRCTCFVLLVSCCHSTLSCGWFVWSRGGSSNIACRCCRLVLASFHWFLGATD